MSLAFIVQIARLRRRIRIKEKNNIVKQGKSESKIHTAIYAYDAFDVSWKELASEERLYQNLAFNDPHERKPKDVLRRHELADFELAFLKFSMNRVNVNLESAPSDRNRGQELYIKATSNHWLESEFEFFSSQEAANDETVPNLLNHRNLHELAKA